MIKALFKLAVFFLIAHALFRFVPPYWTHTEFMKELKERAVTWREHSESDVRDQVLAMAHRHGAPIGAEHVDVRRERNRLVVAVSYRRPIELIPGWKYDWPFDSDVEALLLEVPASRR